MAIMWDEKWQQWVVDMDKRTPVEKERDSLKLRNKALREDNKRLRKKVRG